mgnify:CR=1 FL=1
MIARRAAALVLLLLAVMPASAQQAVDAGDYRVLYAAINSAQLTPEIARRYGITRARDTALITFNAQRRDGGSYTAVAATGTATVRSLIGNRQKLDLRPLREQGIDTLIGTTQFADGEYLIIDAQVLPQGSSTPIPVSFKQQFYRD